MWGNMGWEYDEHRQSARTRRRARQSLRDMGYVTPESRLPVRTHRPFGMDAARSHPDLFDSAHFYFLPDAAVRRGVRGTGPSGESRHGLMTDIQHSAVDLWYASIMGREARHLSGSELRVQQTILVVTAIIASLLLDLHFAVGWAAGTGLSARLVARLQPFAGRLLARFGVQGASHIAATLRQGAQILGTHSAFVTAGARLLGRSVGYLLGDMGESVRSEIVRQLRQWDYPQVADILHDMFSQVDQALDAITPIRTFCEDRGLNISEGLLHQLANHLDQQRATRG